MTKAILLPRVETGVRNLDAICNGGLLRGSATMVCGPPGSGKSILAAQIGFHNAVEGQRILYCNTLSEPSAKTLRYLSQFAFFDPAKLGNQVSVVDLGALLRSQALEDASALVMQHVKELHPTIVVIDSFKVFDDLAKSTDDLRRFAYELVIQLMAWEATVLLLGEYGPDEFENGPIFSIVDGLLTLSQRETAGEMQRFIRVVKMRGTDHSRDEHAFVIHSDGIEVFAPRIAIQRAAPHVALGARCKTHIAKLDDLLGAGILWGSNLLVSGVAGTGKTVLLLEFIYRGALAGEKGILFSFEETDERLRATAAGLGWDLEPLIASGMMEIVFVAQPFIMVEADLLMIRARIEKLGARRVAIDSSSVFLHKIADPQVSREKVFHLCTIVQNAGAVGFFATDIPYGSSQISRLGVEETVVDGVLILSSTEEGFDRHRYIEVYKLRTSAHLKGRHSMVIQHGGIAIFPRYDQYPPAGVAPPAVDLRDRLGSGVQGLDDLLGGGLLRRSVTLISGSAGTGKTIMGLQFLLQGAARGERGLYVTLEEGPDQLIANADSLGLALGQAVEGGLIEILYVSRENIRAGQFLSVLADRLEVMQARRVVLDSVTHMMTESAPLEELRQVLYKLVMRFKFLGVTSLFMIEAPFLHTPELAYEESLSPIADNLFILRYARAEAGLIATLTVVKTRGSAHVSQRHAVSIREGGMHVEGVAGDVVDT